MPNNIHCVFIGFLFYNTQYDPFNLWLEAVTILLLTSPFLDAHNIHNYIWVRVRGGTYGLPVPQ